MQQNSSDSRSGLWTKFTLPPVRQRKAEAAHISSMLHCVSPRAAARAASGESFPLPTGKYGGLATIRSKLPALKSSLCRRISPQTISLRASRAFARMFSSARDAASGTISSPVMCSLSVRASSSSAIAPEAQPRSMPRTAPAVFTKSARSTQSVLRRKCSACAKSGPFSQSRSNPGMSAAPPLLVVRCRSNRKKPRRVFSPRKAKK